MQEKHNFIAVMKETSSMLYNIFSTIALNCAFLGMKRRLSTVSSLRVIPLLSITFFIPVSADAEHHRFQGAFLYFSHTNSMTFSETWHVKSLALSEALQCTSVLPTRNYAGFRRCRQNIRARDCYTYFKDGVTTHPFFLCVFAPTWNRTPHRH